MRRILVILAFATFTLCASAQGVVVMPDGETFGVKSLRLNKIDIPAGAYDLPASTYDIIRTLPTTPNPGNPQEIQPGARVSVSKNLFISDFVDADLFNIPDIAVGMKYRDYGKLYSVKDYIRSSGGIYYSPAVAGVTSALMPGLGHIVLGESSRGGKYMGMWAGSMMLMWSGIAMLDSRDLPWKIYDIKFWHSHGGAKGDEKGTLGAIMVVTGFLTGAAARIMSIVDAVQVAKVKNTYNRSQQRMQTFEYKVVPYISTTRTDHGRVKVFGLEFAAKF